MAESMIETLVVSIAAVKPTRSFVPRSPAVRFGFGGKLLPTFPLDPLVPSYLAWLLKAKFLPWFYW